MRLLFLGTGASGGTPGRARSRRLESSRVISNGTTLLIDVTRHFRVQAERVARIDAILLTHGHRDAIGGLPALRRWWLEHDSSRPIDILLSEATAAVIRGRYRHLEHCRFRTIASDECRRVGALSVSALIVPHARDPRFETFAWRVCAGRRSVVYASDVAHLTSELERFSAGSAALVLDGAMWHKRLFSHLTIDEALPIACSWPVDSIIVTQIGRTAPPHRQLQRQVAALCPKALVAHDGLAISI
ncbi:MAG: MBL fold metallo-hydrolase [Solirubrobacteraceae bacterium]